MEKDINIMPKIDILPHPLRRIGRGVLNLFSMHQLASHGDHFNTVDEMLLDESEVTWTYPSQETLFDADLSGWGYDYRDER